MSEEKAGQEEKLANQIEGLQSDLDTLKGEKENMEKDLQAQIATLKVQNIIFNPYTAGTKVYYLPKV